MNLFNIQRTFEMKKTKGWPEVYWCIDLHGTIIPSGHSANDKTDYMEMYPYAKEVLQWLCGRHDIMTILWTSTPDSRMSDVLNWFEANGIRFTFVNENPHAKDTPRSVFNKKFYMSVILDDRAGFSPIDGDWLLVAKQLEISTGEKIIDWNDDNKTHLKNAIQKSIMRLNDLVIFN